MCAAKRSTESDAAPILPGATLGVLGGGQLGRMFAMAAARLGYRVHVFAPEEDAPAADVAFRQTVGSFDDADALAQFARSVDVVTLEFENIPASAIEIAAKYCPVRPGGGVLHTVQDRLREKNFLRSAGVACATFAEVTTAEQLEARLNSPHVLPAVLKTAAWGYDGKGQSLVRTRPEALAAWEGLQGAPAILESLVDFHCEFSILAVRSSRGEEAFFGPIRNDHANHILDVSSYPLTDLAAITDDAQEIARTVVRALDAVGLICIEFFWAKNGLKVNEIAPRPHNSGHLTIDACACSQFEQQVRAVCGLPLSDFSLLVPAAAMANLLGDVWAGGEPGWSTVLADPRLRLHLYGKNDPRPGRKMGHLTALAATAEEAARLVRAARDSLAQR